MNVSQTVQLAFDGLHTPDAAELDPRNYREGYWALCDLFQDYVRMDVRASMISGATAVYGWMPRIIGRLDDYASIVQPLEGLRGARSGAEALAVVAGHPERESLLRFVNGSVVGTSKFLHFLNPVAIPIWDSRVARNFGIEGAWNVDRCDRFISFWSSLNACAATCPQPFREFCRSHDGRDATAMRLMEYALFLRGRAP